MIKFLSILGIVFLVAGYPLNAQSVYEQGGFNTDVKILGSEKKFDRVRFNSLMFRSWNNQFIRAKTYEFISDLYNQGLVLSDGSLARGGLSLDIASLPNRVIDDRLIADYFKRKYPDSWIFDALIDVGVLNKDGFLADSSTFSDAFNSEDFDIYMPRVRNINYGFKSQAVNDAFTNEIMALLKESSSAIHVTQEEVTRYQSRKKGFLDSFVDQLGGNLLGNVFFKDRVKTVKQKMVYSPNLNPYNLFSNIHFGFSKAPYLKGALGDAIYFGRRDQNHVSAVYGQDDQLYLAGLVLSSLRQMGQNPWDKNMSFMGWQFAANQLVDQDDEDITLLSARILFGGAGRSSLNQFSLGLSNTTASTRGDSRFGLGLGWEGVYHVIPYLGVFGSVDANMGLTFNSDATSWEIYNYQIGLQSALSLARFRLGYGWHTSEDGVMFEGLMTSIGLHF